VTAAFFRQLTEEEYGKLDLDQRIEYMRQLIEHVRARVEDTRQAIEARKRRFPETE
jgi:hypothetical protein